MAEGLIRKSCIRCYTQKTSCKRQGGEACERCVRLELECKSSPSQRVRASKTKGLSEVCQPPLVKRARSTLEATSTHPQVSTPSPIRLEHEDFIDDSHEAITTHQSSASLIMDDCIPLASSVPFPGRDPFDFAAEHSHHAFAPNLSTRPVPPRLLVGNRGDAVPGVMRSGRNLGPQWTSPPPRSSPVCPESSLVFPHSVDIEPGQSLYLASSPDLSPPSNVGQGMEVQDSAKPPYPLATQGGQRRIAVHYVEAMTTFSQGRIIHRISEINTKLWELGAALPYLVGSDGETDTYAFPLSTCDGQAEDQRVSLDTVFSLSGLMIQTMQQLCFGELPGQSSSSTTGEQMGSPERYLDRATSLLILSTYIKLLDIYQRGFHLAYTEVSSARPGDACQLCRLPDVCVASIPVASTPAVQMMFAVRLAEEFLTQLGNDMECLGQFLFSDGSHVELGLGQPSMIARTVESSAALEIKTKEDELRVALIGIRTRLEESPPVG